MTYNALQNSAVKNIKISFDVLKIHLGCVWIELIFAETENWNWKYCNEIIFKYVNSAVVPIFNKKITEKCNLWDREQLKKRNSKT